MKPIVKLKGLDLPPLPYESMESVGARLAWRNGKTIAHLAREMMAQAKVKTWSGLLPGSPTDVGALAYLCGWQEASARAREMVIHLAAEKYHWLYTGFRFCPVCLASGYHSYLFDWEFTKVCPLHDCLLTSRCQTCGEDVLSIKAEATLARYGYRCLHCKEYLAGSAPSLPSHLEFRQQTSLIDSRFKPHDEFARCLMQAARFVLGTWAAFEAIECDRLRPWCRADLVRRMCAYICYFNASQKTGVLRYRDVLCIHWRLKIQSSSFQYAKREHEARTLKGVQVVYNATLRLLSRWIIPGRFSTRQLMKAKQRFLDEQPGQVGDWTPLVLTYLLLRYTWEGNGMTETSDVAKGNIVRSPNQMGLFRFNEHATRLGVRAYLLAMFAIIHSIVLSHQDWNVMDLFAGSGFPIERLLPIHPVERRAGGEGGILALPAIEGMPMWPFTRRGKELIVVPSTTSGREIFVFPEESRANKLPYPDRYLDGQLTLSLN